MLNERLSEFTDRRTWNLSGFTLDRISLDYQVTLLIARPHSSLMVILTQPFALRFESHTALITHEAILTTVPLLRLLHTPVTSLTAFRSGQLLLKFDAGAEIEVQKDDQYESWQTFGEGEVADVQMLCSPHPGAPWGG